jgi:hypothetical protein
MHPSLRPSTDGAPAVVFLTLLTILFAMTPRSVYAQPPTPSQSTDDFDSDLSEYKYLGIGLGLFSFYTRFRRGHCNYSRFVQQL